MNSLRPMRVVATLAWVALAVWGVAGVYERLATGHDAAHYGSYVPWGLWVSAYIYFVGLSAGAFLLSSLVYVFRVRALAPVGRIALVTAAVTLAMALLCIWFDLGHMERVYEVFTRPNFHSLMAWMVWLYSAYFGLILLELWFEMRTDLFVRAAAGSRLARLLTLGWRPAGGIDGVEKARRDSARILRVLGSAGIPLAILFHGGVGALFAALVARPYWHTALYPILFLTGALVSGGGLLLAIVASGFPVRVPARENATRVLARAVLLLLVFDVILEWAEISIPSWYGIGHEFELLQIVLFGPYWYVFWLVHIALGTLIPLVLLAMPRAPERMAHLTAAGLLVATTFMAVRLNLVIPGQVSPQLRGLESAFIDHRLRFDYVPSLFEWSVVGFVVALGIALFAAGCKVLPVFPTESRLEKVNP